MTVQRTHPTSLTLLAVAVGSLLVALAVATGPVRAASHAIDLRDNSFTPRELTVVVGDTVTWTNSGQAIHNVVSNDDAAAAFDSGNVPAGETFSFTFTEPGTYGYACTFHSSGDPPTGMVGTITVVAGTTPNTAMSSGSSGRILISLLGALLLIAGAAPLFAKAGIRR